MRPHTSLLLAAAIGVASRGAAAAESRTAASTASTQAGLIPTLPQPAETTAPGAAKAESEIATSDPTGLQLDFLYEDYSGFERAALARRAAWLGESDLLVALELARRSRADLDVIVTWRREGASWDAVTRRCQLRCDVFYVVLPARLELAPPYARAYRQWRLSPGADLHLADNEIRELVLMRAVSEHCRIAPEQVVRLRNAGHGPRDIALTFGSLRSGEDAAPRAPLHRPGASLAPRRAPSPRG
jgi:hypothetical protein